MATKQVRPVGASPDPGSSEPTPPHPPACLTAELDQTGHFLCLSVLGYKTGMTASTLFGSGTDELSDVPDVLNTVKSKAGV